jgi:2',3'-cyclic-nucleotide 2'-phosphodiesterase (5'-nucleotidase family)
VGGAAPWLRLEWGPARVGLVGLTTPDTAATSSPEPDVRFDPPPAAGGAALAEMGRLDLRVALTHLPLAQDRALASAVPLHLVLGGHDHEPMLHEERGALIIKAGADAVNLGRVEYALGCGARVLERRQRLIPVDDRIPEAPDVAALVRRYAERLERELDAPAGWTPVALDARDAVIRRGETALGRFLADVMRERVGAEVALLNSGAVRANRVLPPGPLTRRDVHQLLPFDNIIVLLEVAGADLVRALERSADALPAAAGRFLQTAGVRYRLDAARPPGLRVSEVLVRDRPLDPTRLYRVATIDYLAQGGDGYAMLAGARVLLGAEDGPALAEAVLRALAGGRSP